MQKEIKEKALKVLAEIIRESIQKNKAPSKLAAEYGLSTATMYKLLKGSGNLEFTTLLKIVEILGYNFSTFAEKFEEKIGKDFTTIDN